jgi:hypothetical protein
MRWPGNEHGQFALKTAPALSITNGVHYSFHSRHDTTHRVNFAALNNHAATLAKLFLDLASQPRIERQATPAYDAEESLEWQRLLAALREQVLKTPANDAGQARIDDALLELKRVQGRPVQDPRAREAVLLRAANLAFFMAHPSAVDANALETQARNAEARSDRAQALAAYQKLLRFIEEDYRRDDQSIQEVRQRISRLAEKP